MNKDFNPGVENPAPASIQVYDYKRWRDQFILVVLRIACVLGIVLVVPSITTASYSELALYASLYVILLFITFARVSYSVRAYLLMGMLYALGANIALRWGPWVDSSVFFLAFIAMSTLLFDNNADIIAISISALTFIIIGILQSAGVYELSVQKMVTTPGNWITYTVDFLIPGALIMAAIRQFKSEFAKIAEKMQQTFDELLNERAQLEERVRERTEELESRNVQLRSSTAVARNIAEIDNINELMDTITGLTSEQFGYYQIGLYLLDENKKTAFLQASSSQAGKRIVGQGFRIEPSRKDPFFPVIERNRYHITTDADTSLFTQDPNFPLTRSRMVLPLAARGEIMGLLDIHSDQTRAFNAQDAEIIQTLADLAAISLDNVRLISETKNLVSQLEANISFQSRDTWTKLTRRHAPAYLFTPAGVRPIFSPKKLVSEDGDDALNIPLALHGQKIGLIKLKRKGVASSWSERERNLVEKIADQVALALENSRLVDEAQKNALRDQMIANISSRVRETLDIESVIRTATTELRKVFDLKEAEISVGLPQSDRNRET